MLAICCAWAAEPTVEIPLWPGPEAKSDPRVVLFDGHPCGTVAIARVSEMPEIDSKVLEPEKVLEITPSGDVLRTWSAPVDAYPMAIDGQFLIMRLGRRSYRIGIDRSIRLLDTVPPNTELEPGKGQECPSMKEFGDSVYVACATFHDLGTGQIRLLAYQGVCT